MLSLHSIHPSLGAYLVQLLWAGPCGWPTNKPKSPDDVSTLGGFLCLLSLPSGTITLLSLVGDAQLESQGWIGIPVLP